MHLGVKGNYLIRLELIVSLEAPNEHDFILIFSLKKLFPRAYMFVPLVGLSYKSLQICKMLFYWLDASKEQNGYLIGEKIAKLRIREGLRNRPLKPIF